MSAVTPERPDEVGVDQIGYLAEGGALVPVRIDSVEDGKLVAYGVDNKERRISTRRLLWRSAALAPDRKALSAHWRQTQGDAAGWDAEAAWGFLVAEGKLDPQRPEALLASLPEALRPATIDGMVLAVFDDPHHFRMRAGEVHPTSVEAMEIARAEAAERQRRAETLERVVAALRGQRAGEPIDPALQPEVDLHLSYLEAVALHGNEVDPDQLDPALKLMNEMGWSAQGDPRHPAFDALCALGVFGADENLALRREAITTGFSPETLKEAAAGPGWSLDGRQDFRSLYTVAIDAPHTTEVDDAFAMDGNRLVVFIADAAEFLPVGGAVDTAAAERISTLYLADGIVPMLPPALGQGIASLSVDEDRPALAMSFRLAPDGAIADFEVQEAVCRLDARISYTEANRMLQGEESDQAPRAGALIRMAQRLMASHRQWRVGLGALQLQRSEVNIEVNASGAVEIETIDANSPARQLVSEMMIGACGGVATWCIDRGVPSIYRCQARPKEGGGPPGGEVVNPAKQDEILRRLQPTLLTTRPGLHYTLALEAYIQVSSPLRRYGDLVMHRQIKATLRGEAPPMDDAALRALCQVIERRTGAIRRIEYETRRYWTLKHLAQHPTQVRTAVCIRPVGPRWLVALEGLAQRALIRPRRRLQAGMTLAVVVDKVNPRRNKIVMREVE